MVGRPRKGAFRALVFLVQPPCVSEQGHSASGRCIFVFGRHLRCSVQQMRQGPEQLARLPFQHPIPGEVCTLLRS